VNVERALRSDPERTDDAVRALGDEPVEGTDDPVEEVERIGAQQSDTERALDGEVLRRQLADDDVQVRDDHERDGEREHVEERLRRVTEPAEEWGDERRDRGLADPADRQRRERDAELRRGNVLVQAVADARGQLRRRAPAPRELVDLRLAHANK
jgi:hypothetical protein